MEVELEPGKYVVAVSGGVDSVALLHALQKRRGAKLVVAHFDHGIREDSADDRKFVQKLAERYGLPFEYAEGQLGPDASEADARAVRYDFLEKVRRDHHATAIVTAHHEDDLLETAIINILRGTGRKGLSALGSRPGLRRPLLRASKRDVIDYATSEGLEWREDSTNREEAYLRNYIRRQLLPHFTEQDKRQLLEIIERSKDVSAELDTLLAQELRQYAPGENLSRKWFVQLPHAVAREVMAAWLRSRDVRNFDRRALERLVVAAKVGSPGSRFDVLGPMEMRVGKDDLALAQRER